MGGIVLKTNPNGTVGVLLDNNSIDLAVPRDKIFYASGVLSFVRSQEFLAIVAWVHSAGVRSLQDQISTAVVLYRRGWRADRLYLLEMSDIHLLNHLSKSDRMSLMEKAEWQRDHHRQMQSIYKERIKEKDKRYLFSKYAGILSASVAFVGASSLFGWNYKNYLKKTREYQMGFAVDALCRPPAPATTSGAGCGGSTGANGSAANGTSSNGSGGGGGAAHPGTVRRPDEERWIRQILMRLDIFHPRVVVLTGYIGCGKSTLVRQVLHDCGTSCVYVDVRSREDTLRSVIKALGVLDVDACGDPTDFIAEACMLAKARMRGKIPLLVLKLRGEDSLSRVYNEAVTLACDRRVCHLVIEVPMESLTMANTSLPRLDYYTVPTFSRAQAFEYAQHRIDPLDMEYFLGVVGTNSNDLDELFSSALQRHITPAEYARQKLLRAMRQVQNAWAHSARVKRALKQLAGFPYTEGQREGVDEVSLRDPAVRDVVIYNPVQDCWVFASQVLHTASRCCL
ncbi:tuzin [Strigomonas culicis]|nr:tuzin [Strigomonas culicis]|eukprot:EPY34747.1 tuzin [Strigomonas culicis]